jgi:[ribosomal protein S18]-alanine N-acetyltransferase
MSMQSEKGGLREAADYRVVRMSGDDVKEVARIEELSFSDPWSETSFASTINSPYAYAIAAKREESVIGYLVGYVQKEYFQIANIAVSPHFRRRGIGRELLFKALEEATRRGCTYAFLEVRPSNVDAIRLYEEMGFQAIGRRHGYYRTPPEDALVMRRRLF